MFSSSDGATDVGKNTSFSNGSVVKKFVEFLVVSDGQKNVSGNNSGLLVVLGGISGKFEDLSSEVLKNSSQIDWGSSSNSFGVVSMSQESSNSSDGELESRSG